MRRSIMLLAKCYPRAWRERYGVEFDALMEDVEPDLREFANVLGGAVRLQLQGGAGLFKIAGVMALLGLLASVGVWKIAPQRYVSTAQLRVTTPPGANADQVTQDLERLQQEILSRGSLVEIIQRPSLKLYPGERQRIPMEDVIQQMRHDIEVRRVGGEGLSFSVSFAYPNRFKAQAVTRELLAKFVQQSAQVARYRENLWQAVWKESAPPGGKVEVTAPATDPRDPESYLATFLAWGLGAGLTLGMLAFAVMCQPRVMRQLALCGLAGCVLGGAASFLIPEVYVSEAAMRITPPLDPQRWYAGSKPESVFDRVERMKNAVWSKLKDGSERHIRIVMLGGAQKSGTFSISATAGSGIKAQAMVREVVRGFVEQYGSEEQARQGEEIRFMAEHRLGPNLEVLDPASFPQTPASPNRAVMAMLGLLAGLLTGAAMVWRRRPRAPAMTAEPQPI